MLSSSFGNEGSSRTVTPTHAAKSFWKYGVPVSLAIGVVYAAGLIGGFVLSGMLQDTHNTSVYGAGLEILPGDLLGACLGGTLLTYAFLLSCFRFARRARFLILYARFAIICPVLILLTLPITGGIANSDQPHQNIFEVALGAINLVVVIALSWLLSMHT